MNHKVIKTEEELKAALERFHEVFLAEPGTPEEEESNLLAILIESYEKKVHAIAPPDPLTAIKCRMEDRALVPQDLVPFIGSLHLVNEVLDGRRALTLPMIRKLASGLDLSERILVQKMAVSKEKRLPKAA